MQFHVFRAGWWFTYPSEKYEFVSFLEWFGGGSWPWASVEKMALRYGWGVAEVRLSQWYTFEYQLSMRWVYVEYQLSRGWVWAEPTLSLSWGSLFFFELRLSFFTVWGPVKARVLTQNHLNLSSLWLFPIHGKSKKFQTTNQHDSCWDVSWSYESYRQDWAKRKNKTHMLHGAGIFTNTWPNKITQFCR